MNICVVYNLPSREMQKTRFVDADIDTEESAKEIAQALREKGAAVELFPISEDTIASISSVKADVIFNQIEWDGHDFVKNLRAVDLIEQSDIPFTGSSRDVIEKTSDKRLMKTLLAQYNLPTPIWQIFETGQEDIRPDFCYPVIIKTTLIHCSIGLGKDAIAYNKNDLSRIVQQKMREFGQPVFAEEFIEGREFQVTIVEKKEGLAVLPPAEITFTTKGVDAFLSYESRWVEDSDEFHTSGVKLAEVTEELLRRIEDISVKAFRSFGIRDYSRLDIRIRDSEIFILEANSNPGLGDNDLYGMTLSYQAAGMTFADFVWEIVQSCLRRNQLKME